jgi:hypothetical protein
VTFNPQRLTPWASRIARLAAWGRPLEEVTIELRNGSGVGSSGTAWPGRRRIIVTVGSDPALALATVLHEYAHCAAPGNAHHGLMFKERLRAGTIELTNWDPGLIDNYRIFQSAVDDVIKHWWRMNWAGTWNLAQRFEGLR